MRGTCLESVGVLFPKRLANSIFKQNPPITLLEIEHKSGVSRRTVSRWLNAESEPCKSTLLAVCDAMEWDYNWLVGRADEPRLFKEV